MKKPIVLTIMDGFGYNPEHKGNAIYAADTPRLDEIMRTCPHTLIGASGLDVGLPDGQMGNSEVGHTNIGAGRIVYQELTRITKSISDGDFFTNKACLDAVENCSCGVTEMFLHPAKEKDDPTGEWKKRVFEYEILKSGDLLQKAEDKKIRIISWADFVRMSQEESA